MPDRSIQAEVKGDVAKNDSKEYRGFIWGFTYPRVIQETNLRCWISKERQAPGNYIHSLNIVCMGN